MSINIRQSQKCLLKYKLKTYLGLASFIRVKKPSSVTMEKGWQSKAIIFAIDRVIDMHCTLLGE